MSIIAKRKASGLSQQVLADRLKMSKSQFSRLERSPSKFKSWQLQILASTFNCTVDELIGDGEITPTPLASMGRALPVCTIEEGKLVLTEHAMHFSGEASLSAMWVTMPDASMAPRINEGDDLVVDPAQTPRPGSIVLAEAPVTGEHVVRYYVPLHPTDPRAPGFILRAENKGYPEMIASGAGRIVGVVTARQETFQ